MKYVKTYQNLIGKFFLILFLIIPGICKLTAQSVPLPTDRARIHVAEITDPTDVTKKLKVLRTDANTPLRGASPWITNKATQENNAEISAAFFKDQANENLNSVRIIWFQAWFEGYAIQNGTTPNPAEITDFNDPVQVQHCLDVLEVAVNNASANGMYACINFHSPWKGPIHLPYAKQFWTVVAPYFANRTHVIFEQSNEPVPGSGTYTAANDRGGDMNSQVELYNIIRNAAPDAFILVMTPPSCEGDFTASNEFIKGVQRFESLAGPIDWSKTGVGYHTYYLGWNNSCNCALTTSVPMRAIHRAYPAMSTEVNWPAGVVNTLNSEPGLDGEQFQVQTHERLGLGWWLWAVSHPDNSAEGWYANFHKLKNDAISKGYFWGKDQTGIRDSIAPTDPSGLMVSGITSNSLKLSWNASTDSVGVNFYAIFNGSAYLGSSDTTYFELSALTPGTTFSFNVKAYDEAGNSSNTTSASDVTTLLFDASIPFTETVPVIDGTEETIWTGTKHKIENLVMGKVTDSVDLSANWTALYDNSNIYLFINVTDDTIKVETSEWYFDDRIEIFIDADGDRAQTFGDRDYQYYIRPGETKLTETRKNAIANIQIANVTVAGGYKLEVKIPFATLGILPESGKLLGFDIKIADDDNGGEDDGRLSWNSLNDLTHTSPTLFGVIKLGPNPDVVSPSAPTELVCSSATASSFILNWTASDDNVGVTGYEVFKDGVSIGTTTLTTFNLTGLTANTTYSITVTARDAAGNRSALSSALSASTLLNIALNKPVSTSSVFSATYSGEKAVDAVTLTQWRSANADANPWIVIDLGATYSLINVKISWFAYFAKDYLLQISNDLINFTTFKTLTGQNGLDDEHPGLSAMGRYLRIFVNAKSSPTIGVYIREVEVYGSFEWANFIANQSDVPFSIFPNPATDYLTILNVKNNSLLTCYSMDGKIVYNNKVSSEGNINIPIDTWKKGIYLFRTQHNSNILVKKFVVQ